MPSRLVLSIICCALALVAHATDIYRWVDDQGRTHFADVVPERYKSVATKIDSKSSELSEGARAEAAARAARERTQAEFEAAQRARSQAAKTAAPPLSTSTASQPPRNDSGDGMRPSVAGLSRERRMLCTVYATARWHSGRGIPALPAAPEPCPTMRSAQMVMNHRWNRGG